MKDRLIFHIDVNSAFLSWESVYRLSLDPNALDLRTIPSAVGGDASSRHGIILAKSTPAKKFGVVTGEPLTQALKKCPQLTVVPSRFDYYIQCSDKMMDLLANYTPDREQFSIDETFLDMTSTIHLFGEPLAVANAIREEIKHKLGFTVNVGIGPNKLLAKMASDFEKPDKCHTLFSEEIPQKLWPLPIRDLFFVGGSAQKKLESLGIRTIGQLASSDLSVLKGLLGNKYAETILRYANGIDDSPVAPKEAANKGCGNSITLSRDVKDYDTACHVLLSLCETVGARLRASDMVCSSICVELKDWRFSTHSHQTNLSEPTSSTAELYQTACRLLKEFWDLTPVRLIGVRAGKLQEEGFTQLSLFEDPLAKKKKAMEKTVDAIREKFGTDSIKRASFLAEDSIVDHAVSKKKHLGRLEKTRQDNIKKQEKKNIYDS